VLQYSLRDLFAARVADLNATRTARAYIEGVFNSQVPSERAVDLSRESVVLAYARVRERFDFEQAQRLADWILWNLSWFPESVSGHREVVESLGRLSYYRCYRIIPSWIVFDELADELPRFVRELAQR